MKILNTETNDKDLCEKAFEDLYYVDDPEVGLNVVDLGLVYGLEFKPETQELACTMTLTTEYCPMGESIQENITNSLESSFPDWDVDITLTFDPPWEASMISVAGQDYLGW